MAFAGFTRGRLDQRAVAGIQPRQCHRTGDEPGHEHCSGANQDALSSLAASGS